ncbi:uncharacterized protein [Typha angustifolia]|uniref:uncharacterized protein n=1 Tax=Typha angustifolia TaxID=59011 RepID=UPI003C2FD1D6
MLPSTKTSSTRLGAHLALDQEAAMAETNNPSNIREALEKANEHYKDQDAYKEMDTPDAMRAARVQVQTAAVRGAYGDYVTMPEEPPTRIELVGWYIYGLCSYFVLAVLVPVLFPLIISQIAPSPDSPPYTIKGVACSRKEMALYQKLVHHSIVIGSSKLSALNWTAISWAVGIFVASPLLTQLGHHLDRGQHQSLILIAATTVGSFSCLLTGFFKTVWLFPFYIAAVISSIVVAEAAHTRYLGLMVRGLTAGVGGRQRLLRRRAVSSRLSLYSTAIGSVGAAIIAAFVYHMLRRSDQLTSLWVVSIFSGLAWFVGICHGLVSTRPACSSPSSSSSTSSDFASKLAYALAVFNYPHAVGGLAAVFLSSFSSTCIFTGAVLYVVGGDCIKPVILLTLWIFYFMFPAMSLPLLYPFQMLIRADAVSMQLLGFLLSAFASGAGFYYKGRKWNELHVILMGLVQSTAAGLLHAFGRVLLLDCTPAGKEGAFAVWFATARAIGGCIGFAIGSASPGHVGPAFAVAFLASFVGLLVLIFGNVSNVGGVVAAGHVEGLEDERRSSAACGVDKVGEGMNAIEVASSSGEERDGYGGRVRV